jgi:N-acyl-L-homoserine lactone synthetase
MNGMPQIAASEAERLAIYRFRYRVFAEHLGRRDLDGADHAQRMLTDPLDPVSTHYWIGAGGEPVAALTLSPVDVPAVSAELSSFLDLPRLAQAVSLDRVAFANWLLVDPAQAGSAAVTSLIAAAAERALDEEVALVLTYCRPGLVSFYERLGFEQYTHATDVKGIGLRCPLLLVLRDGARLKAVRSPLQRLLRRKGVAEAPDDVRLRLEPLIDLFQASQILANDELWIDSAVSFVPRAAPRLFDGLGDDSVRQIMKLAGVISCRAGETITRRGETSDDMFLVVAGDFAAGERALGEGDLFGEVEHLSGTPRVDTVTALTAGHVAALKAEALFLWMRQNPEPGLVLAVNLARLLAARAAA